MILLREEIIRLSQERNSILILIQITIIITILIIQITIIIIRITIIIQKHKDNHLLKLILKKVKF